jgi:5-methylthioribose kinase
MLELEENSGLEVLQDLPFWEKGELLISSKSAGEGNMNLVLRVKTNLRSVILKQSKPYVRKYPQIPAPINRIIIERTYYFLIGSDPVLKSFSPKVLAFYPESHLLITEDLGTGSDFSFLYQGKATLDHETLSDLAEYLNALHGLKIEEFPDNSAMKILNHEHIFNFPFEEENGFDLNSIQPGLQEISLIFKRDRELKKALNKLGERYLSDGNTLLQGDFYPGSWLKMEDGLKIIDPEFGFMGDKEFDLGVLFAHFDMSQQHERLKEEFLKKYNHSFSSALINQYQGVEILRRLIGIAQLPVDLTLQEKRTLLEKARQLVLFK